MHNLSFPFYGFIIQEFSLRFKVPKTKPAIS